MDAALDCPLVDGYRIKVSYLVLFNSLVLSCCLDGFEIAIDEVVAIVKNLAEAVFALVWGDGWYEFWELLRLHEG